MNERLELEKIELGSVTLLPLPSKSLLTTINTGFNVSKLEEPEDLLPIIVIDVSPQQEIKKKPSLIIPEPIELPPKKDLITYADDSIKTTVETGFVSTDKTSLVPCEPILKCHPHKNEDSVIDSMDTGFGCSNTLVKDCPKPKYKTHLCKENYLGEFKTETEKLLARTNLGVYSKEEINDIVSKIVENNTKDFVTKGEVLSMISNLDFVNSTLRSYANYEIPSDLFKL